MIRRILEQGAREIGLEIPEEHIQAFELFADQLKKWNRKINLTAIVSDEEIAVKHIIDALVFAGSVRDGERVLDIGSGAGVPAIPLKIVKPAQPVTSVDAVGKKILFQRHVARLLKFSGFEAVHARVEELCRTRGHGFDLITSRAFSRLEQFVALAAPLLVETGRLVAMKGPGVAGEIRADEERLAALGFEIVSVTPYRLPFDKGERNLIEIVSRKAA
ncbi:16S rRNA (guanine(527)-N(7))-methyltransferase RsmG [Geobacter sp. FeAm09]|uniref:16S rRNA (guanine(527)-N(7))-methyltransferase RsmG n=1 Tax=Geobacter sp. FeAm09 TaxID=2597769 RepID=UPI0011EBD614|nr:16S rRNA (guanine(527)-N(7))-methyltransferase RsmG [Geobacter sp. FeAm09]QEM69910.1 16S rRNA (guanine(527)-N(7))-methyltransferase RsmG [Geobacter sp. FeAm09]